MMLCDNCNKNEASIHIQEVIGSTKKTFHLCAECASTHNLIGNDHQNVNLTAIICNLAAKALEQEQVDADVTESTEPVLKCTNCGLTNVEFRKHGRLGCRECYETFATLLQAILAEVHRGKTHVGRVPDGGDGESVAIHNRREVDPLPVLEHELKRAVASEAYERAAEIRDKIRQLSVLQKDARTQ